MRRVRRAGSARRTALTSGYVISCVLSALVLAASGVSYFVMREIGGIGGSNAITGTSSVGAQNILLMGLESRTDWNGNVLPWSILRNLHAGSVNGVTNQGVGGNATNTLILIHIPAGGGHAEAVSIPRDDMVSYAGMLPGAQQQGKIDGAYGINMAAEENLMRQRSPGMSQDEIALRGNEAGQYAEIKTVERLTGVRIDHFAEVNLVGFYELATVFDGVEVCLRHPVPLDQNSGFFARRAGPQHLNPEMALAFVRQRDGLPNGDLDRTHRQQAFLDAVVYQMRGDGILSDLSKIEQLLKIARQYVITDSGWNLLDFIQQARSLVGGRMTAATAPISGYVQNDPTYGDYNTVDPAYVAHYVHKFFWPPAKAHATAGRSDPAPAATATIDVYNGGHTPHLAARVSAALGQAGYRQGLVTDTGPRATTAVVYGPGAAADARWIASLFHVTAKAGSQVAAGHIQVLLAATAKVPAVPGSGTARAAAATPAPSANPANNGANGSPITVSLGNSIPCVN